MSTPTVTTELSTAEHRLWDRLSALFATVPAALDEGVRALTGINHFHYTILRAISTAADGSLQLTEIARVAESSLSRLSHAITRLESAGLVSREVCAHDRRATWAVLTPAGADLVRRTDQDYITLARVTVLERVPEHQRDILADLIEGILPPSAQEQCEVFAGDLQSADSPAAT